MIPIIDLSVADSEKEVKQQCRANSNNRGWNPVGEETLNPEAQSKGDTKEGYYIGREVAAGSAEAALPLHGPNVWPDERRHPSLARWRDRMEAYYGELTTLARRLLPLFALALGLPRDTFLQPGYFDRPVALLRLLRYTSELSTPESGVLACGAHSDYGMFTLLTTDEVPGLQILVNEDGGESRWVDVPPRPGDFVVNIGDLLQRWSNDVFKSTVHRVVNYTATERYSMPFFFEPNFTCIVECFPQCCVDGHGNKIAPKHKPTTAGQYLLDRYNETHADFESQSSSPSKL